MSPNEIVIDAILLFILVVGMVGFIRAVRRHWCAAGKLIDAVLRKDK